MRTIDVAEITENIKEMCIEANHFLTSDMDALCAKCRDYSCGCRPGRNR